MANILQAPILTDFLYPFLLMFFIVFALLEKAKILGEGKQQLNAFVSLVISLIFVSVVFPVMVVNNLILFMTIGIVILFVGFMLWGFISGKSNLDLKGTPFKILTIVIILSVVIAVLIITGVFPSLWSGLQTVFSWLFDSNKDSFWTNFIIVALVVLAVVAVLKGSGGEK